MIYPVYYVTEWDSGYVAHVRYGFIFRKTERVGISLRLGSAVALCEMHHSLHHPGRRLRLGFRMIYSVYRVRMVNGELKAQVTHGFLFRKTETISSPKSVDEAIENCMFHHSLHRIPRTIRIRINV